MLCVMMQTIEDAGKSEQQVLEQLLLQIAAGDREALAALYHRTRAAVYAMTLSLLKNADDAADATQDAFVRIWDAAPQYRAKGTPMAWILTVAKNLALMRLREHGRRGELSEDEWQALPAAAAALSAEERDLLQNALAQLSDEERRVVLLHTAAGLKHREIASLLELPLPTVLSKYHRAIKKLQKYAKGDEPS